MGKQYIQKYRGGQARQRDRNKRTPLEQLQRLDFYLGKNQGATKERVKLQAQIEAGRGKKS